jgi:monoamine oxidase
MVSSRKVCVVGAGVSGLVSARELLREGHDVTVMEQSGGVGGQWLYEPRTNGGDPLGMAGVYSGVYASLRLNAPRDSMGFSDFPFYPKNDGTGDARRYPGHGEFLRYIRDFSLAYFVYYIQRAIWASENHTSHSGPEVRVLGLRVLLLSGADDLAREDAPPASASPTSSPVSWLLTFPSASEPA